MRKHSFCRPLSGRVFRGGLGNVKEIDDFYRTLLDNLHDGVYFTDRKRRIHYWNGAATRITGFHAGEVLGHCCADNILTHVDDQGKMLCLSECPLTEAMDRRKPVEKDVFLHHKAGHRVPVSVRVCPIFDEDDEVVGAVETFGDNSCKLQALERIEELQKIAFVDPLTGVGNRRYGEDMCRNRLDEFRRYGWTFGILCVDVDRLKEINDRHGHDTGDEALALVARTLVANVRSFDFVARWGGDEFLVIVTNIQPENAHALAEKLGSLVAASTLPSAAKVRLSVTIGGTFSRPSDSFRSILKRADQLLYQGKASGRNCVLTDLVTVTP
jgi:diguanylate cyclase (GGDEF)-like protein/PAS domain S-box-containing protein